MTPKKEQIGVLGNSSVANAFGSQPPMSFQKGRFNEND